MNLVKLLHIVIDARHFRRATGGIGRYTQALIAALAKIDATNRYTILLDPTDRAEWDELVGTECLPPARFVPIVVDIPYYSFKEQTTLPRLLAKLRPDVVHFTNFNHPLTWYRPFVVTIHDLTMLKFPTGASQTSSVNQLGFRASLWHAAMASRLVLTDSESSKRDIVAHLPAKAAKVRVTYPAVTGNFRAVNLPQRGRIQAYLSKEYGIRPPYFLFTSQWRPHKGITTLVSAYERYRDDHPDGAPARLVIAGKPQPHFPEIPAMIERSRYNADILRPGFFKEEDLPKLYQAAEAFLFPSLYEGFGIPPLEALACGTPVVCSNSSSLPEVVGDAAILLPPTDVAAWAHAMHQIVTDRALRRSLTEKAASQARKFSWQRTAEQTLEAYRQTAKS